MGLRPRVRRAAPAPAMWMAAHPAFFTSCFILSNIASERYLPGFLHGLGPSNVLGLGLKKESMCVCARTCVSAEGEKIDKNV